jgi:hypothetical protein
MINSDIYQWITLFCLLGAFVILLVLAVTSSKEHFGPFMDNACMEHDCNDEAGRKAAVEKCQKEFTTSSGYAMMKSACDNPDPEIRMYSCIETCDPDQVSAYVQFTKPDTMPPSTGEVKLETSATDLLSSPTSENSSTPAATSIVASSTSTVQTSLPNDMTTAPATLSSQTIPAWIRY